MGHATLGLIVTLTLGLLLSPLASAAQPSPKVYQIGTLWLGFSAPASSSVLFAKALFKAFQQDLHDLSYVEGRNLVFEHRHAAQSDQLHALAAELVRLNVDVILAPGTPQALAAMHATTRIPVVFMALADPVEVRLVASLAHPGGNLTGLTILAPEHSGKRLELLKEAVPDVARVAVLG
jgi:putative ABC transport system substrate-binding protein